MVRIRGRLGALAMAAALLLSSGAYAGEQPSPNAIILMNAPVTGGGPIHITDPLIRAANSLTSELFSDLALTSVMIQREFRRTLPSIANYSQTAHRQNTDESSLCMSYRAPNTNWVMWDTPFLVNETRKRDDGYLGYTQQSSGFATGISRLFGPTTAVGLAVGYDYRKLSGRDGYQWRERADAFHAALYGGTAVGRLFVDSYAGYSFARQRTQRLASFNALHNTYMDNVYQNNANFSDNIFSAGLKASYVWTLANDMHIVPALGLDYSYIRSGAFTENGHDLADGSPSLSRLSVGRRSHSLLQMPVNVAINRTFASSFLTYKGAQSLWTPEIRAGWTPQFGSKQVSSFYGIVDSLGSSIPIEAKSTALPRSYGTVGAGLKIKLADKLIFSIDYDLTYARKYMNHSLTGTCGVSF